MAPTPVNPATPTATTKMAVIIDPVHPTEDVLTTEAVPTEHPPTGMDSNAVPAKELGHIKTVTRTLSSAQDMQW